MLVGETGRHGAGDFMELIAGILRIRIEKDNSNNGGENDYMISLHRKFPFLYVDNVKVDLIDARAVPQTNIDFINVIRAGSNSNDYALASGGVIAIYTKHGSRDREDLIEKKSGTINFKLPGFYTAREFYAPDYSSSDNEEVRREDKRTTLYWQPKIFTNGYENANVSFYTSDEKGRFQIEVEGMTDSGTPIYTSTILEVE